MSRRSPASLLQVTAVAAFALAACAAGSWATAQADSEVPTVRSHDGPKLAHVTGAATLLAGRLIVLDPGHNGGNADAPSVINRPVPAGRGRTKACNTTGTATRDKRLSESRFNWLVAQDTMRILHRRGAKVRLTRSSDTGVGPCINRRAAIGNQARADAVVSIHADGAPPSGHGFHVIYPALTSALVAPSIVAPSLTLAQTLRSALARAGRHPANYIGSGGLNARGDLGGINLSRVPTVFVELGNMRSGEDAPRLKSAHWRGVTALALANGLSRYLRR